MYIENFTNRRIADAIEKDGSISPYIEKVFKNNKEIHTKGTIDKFGDENPVQKKIFKKLKEEYPHLDVEMAIFDIEESTCWIFTADLKGYMGLLIEDSEMFTMSDGDDENNVKLIRLLNDLSYKQSEKNEDFVIKKDIEKREKDRRVKNQARAEDVPELTGEFDEDISALMNWSRCFREFSDIINGNMLNISNRALHRIGRATYSLCNDPIGGEEEMTIYRAMPVDKQIEAGDWVSNSFEYAEGHLSNTDGASFVESLDVPQNEVYLATDGNEYLYIPAGTWDDFDSLEDLWKSSCPKKKMEYPKVKPRKYSCIIKEKNGDCEMAP